MYGFRGGVKVCSDQSLKKHKAFVHQTLESGLESELLINEREKE
jgi:hypothetical protein